MKLEAGKLTSITPSFAQYVPALSSSSFWRMPKVSLLAQHSIARDKKKSDE